MIDDAQQRHDELKISTAAAFVEIAAALVSDFDASDVMAGVAARSVELLNASAAGILLADRSGSLAVAAASNAQIELLELHQIQYQRGPCIDCYTRGETVMHPDLDQTSPWPEFAVASVAAGFPSVHAIPLRVKRTTLGCLNLFMAESVVLTASDIVLAQALADVATIAIVQDRALRDGVVREGSLQNALMSRITIEQAKGMIAERSKVDMDIAFGRLRAYARHTNQRLSAVAGDLAAGTISVAVINRATRPPSPPPRTRRDG